MLILLFTSITTIQAQYSMESYESITPSFDYYYKPFAEQQDIFNLYSPSDVTLKGGLLSLTNPPGPDGYEETPYGTLENALKIPIGNGLGVLIMCLLGYAVRMKKRR